jgi:hypothetical protein
MYLRSLGLSWVSHGIVVGLKITFQAVYPGLYPRYQISLTVPEVWLEQTAWVSHDGVVG